MSKIKKATDFTPKERKRIKERDGGCIFCKIRYHMDECSNPLDLRELEMMHYIPRGQLGLGIAENAAQGCRFHHWMLDNGNKGRRPEMLSIFKEYLQRHYPSWKEEDLVYKKYDF